MGPDIGSWDRAEEYSKRLIAVCLQNSFKNENVHEPLFQRVISFLTELY